jgi:opacity protein-like surface antigen
MATSMRRLLLTMAICLAATPAFADITAFIGANTTPASRQVRGVAVGAGFIFIAFEFEYASVSDDVLEGAPALKTGAGNVLLQSPVAIFGVQPYFTTGGGLYSETLGAHNDKGVAFNTGGGVKISLAGPLQVRIDYRVTRLGSGALFSPAHRIYAGLNLKL